MTYNNHNAQGRMAYINDRDEIILQGRISTFLFYSEVLPSVHEYTLRHNGSSRCAPVISIADVEWIDSNALPCILCLGIMLKKYYRKPSRLHLEYRPDLLQYLDITRFFYYARRAELYDFDNDLIGGFGDTGKEYNERYRLEQVAHENQSYYELDEDGKREIKYRLQDQLEWGDTSRMFGEVLGKIMPPTQSEYNICILALSEMICNAMLYSKSDSYTCVQAFRKRIQLSICDCGIGFWESLRLTGRDCSQISQAAEVGEQIKNSSLTHDFFAFFSALQYSEKSERNNLWALKNLITENKGTIRFHFNKTQIVFTSERCSQCGERTAEKCMNCMLLNYTDNLRLSPLRFYRTRLDGVHIEIDFYKDEGLGVFGD